MSLINYSRYKYTPDEMAEDEFLSRFVVRNYEFQEIFDDIKGMDFNVANQHYIIIGQRGQGKTTLLRKIMLEVNKDEKLSKFLLPVKFAEEQYQIRSLCRLWEEIADYLQTIHEDEFEDILDNLEEHFEDDDYELKCFSYLEASLKSKNKKLLLLIDNIDELLGKLKEKEQRQLREILLTSSSFVIVGGSTKMLEQHFDYKKPFFEFFKIIKLQGLNRDESLSFLRAIGVAEQKEKIEAIIKNEPQRIETLRRLTGGLPRTLVMLFDIFLDEDGNAFEDLLKILDEATPLYKHRMDDLPPMLQDIVHAIAINWDGMLTKEIAKKTKLVSKVVSAQLKQLEKYQLIESESVGKNKIYKIQERFFNIWYLMRHGRKKDRQKVEWLVKFLVSWCSPKELEDRSKKLIELVKKNKVSESYAFHMSEALGYAGLDMDIESEMKENVKEYLLKENSKFVHELSKSDKEILNDSELFYYDDDFDNTIRTLNKIKKSSNKILEYIGKIKNLNILTENYWQNLLSKKEQDEIELKYKNKFVTALLLLISEEFKESYTKFIDTLQYSKSENIEINLSLYLTILLHKKQYYKLKEFLDIPEYNLKNKYKPIWYALMTIMQDEFPNEIKKMGSELKESVDEILKNVKILEKNDGV